MVQITIKILHALSGISKSIYLPLHAYLLKINFIAFVSNSLEWSNMVILIMKLPVLLEPLKQNFSSLYNDYPGLKGRAYGFFSF